MRKNRKNNEMRKVIIEKGPMGNAYGHALISFGNTKVLCTASLEQSVPEFAERAEMGWLSAEYNMLPGSTLTRKRRALYKPDSRSIEIQRLIGRSLRAAVDLNKINGFSLTIDCDVLQADGGTRTASITGGYCALAAAILRMQKEGLITGEPLKNSIASISGGMVAGDMLLDLEYSEDSRAEVDCNVVMNDRGRFIEVQATGEAGDIGRDEFNSLLDLCGEGIEKLFILQKEFIATLQHA